MLIFRSLFFDIASPIMPAVEHGTLTRKSEVHNPSCCRRSYRLRPTGTLMLVAVFSSLTAARAQQPLHVHEHVPVEVDPMLGWSELITATVRAHPQHYELAARAAEAGAWTARAGGWLAGSPSLYVSMLSDRVLDDTGQREYETGIDLPLWRPGQRRAVGDLSEALTGESVAATAALRWEIAGQLRSLLWDIAEADNAVRRAEEAVAVANELVRVVERRHEAGDLPDTDVLLARTALLDTQKVVLEREAMLLDSERGYRSLTGLDRRPAEFAEPLSVRETFDSTHPLLALADAEVTRARANAEFVSRATRGNPVLNIGPRRQRDAGTSFFNDSLSVGVRVPFGGARHRTAETAAALRRVAEAQSRHAALLRQLDLDLHEAEHSLDVTEESLALAEQQEVLTARQWELGQTAFAQGEIELRDLLRIQDAAQSAAREAARLRLARQRFVAAVNQALGELP
jgi:outer membrane protein, heavy metal efflux system